MTEAIGQCMSLLRAMRSVTEWDDGQRQLYAVVLGDMEPESAIAAVKEAVLTLAWRPAPSELREIAIRKALDVPYAGEVETEIMALAQVFGIYGAVDPECPNIRLAGAPEISLMAAKVVEMLGGWYSFCTESTEGRVPLDKRIAQAHGEICRRMLSGDPGVRDLYAGARKLVRPADSPESRLDAVRGIGHVVYDVAARLMK